MSSVYLVDDHPVVRDGLGGLLSAHGHHVLGGCGEPTQALADIVRLVPQILMLDLNLGKHSGLALLESIVKRGLPTRTIVLTASVRLQDAGVALRMGASGYLLKGSSAEQIMEALDAVGKGQRYLTPEAANIAVQALAHSDDAPLLASLSVRERQVVELVVTGHSSLEIGELLHLSPKTVDTYRSRVMAKLAAPDLPSLVRLAIRQGLIEP
jgi:two-component system, NarL family, invasion response regulator UvrY